MFPFLSINILVGRVWIPYHSPISSLLSYPVAVCFIPLNTWWKCPIPSCSTAWRHLSGEESSDAMHTISSPSGAYFSCKAFKCGLPLRQGTHQLAQKSKITYFLPFSSSKLNILSLISFRLNMIAGLPGEPCFSFFISSAISLPERLFFTRSVQWL